MDAQGWCDVGYHFLFDKLGNIFEGRANSTILVPPFDDMAIAKGCNALWSVDDIAPAYPGVVVAARRTFLREHPDAARRYVSALLHANEWAAQPANSEAAQAALTTARYSPKSAAILARDIVPDLMPSAEGWEETVSLRRECGLMPEKPIGEVIHRSVIAGAKAG